MSRLNESTVAATAKVLLDGVQQKFGRVPTMMQAMAISPAVLNAYLRFSGAIAASSLSVRLREQIGMLTAETNGCSYCLAAHHTVGRRAGLTDADLEQSRHGLAADDKTMVALQFAKEVLARAGHVQQGAIEAMRGVGYSEAEILEVIACVALNVFTNFFNSVAEPKVDFPAIPARAQALQGAAVALTCNHSFTTHSRDSHANTDH